MLSTSRIAATILIFVMTTICWTTFGGMMASRTGKQRALLDGRVQELWGEAHTQRAPQLRFHWSTTREVTRTETQNGRARHITETVTDAHDRAVMPSASEVNVDLKLDERLKGVLWYSLYDVAFDGHWSWQNDSGHDGSVQVSFAFPDAQGVYDGFTLVVNGVERSTAMRPQDGMMATMVDLRAGEPLDVRIAYRSRGKDAWTYEPSREVNTLEHFKLTMTTDFRDIDFPPGALSPSSKSETANGWLLTWDFARAVTGRSIGMVMPQHIQPGELASTLAFSAPVSLFFFLVVMLVLCVLRGIDLHPMNILFLAAGFFAFHLLFGYSVDHLHVVTAFALSSVVSMVLVVSYMRLVVSARFAGVQVAGAQLVYLVGFSLAHFFDGFTGLTVTLLGILTLFAIMQLTGRIRWSDVGRGAPPVDTDLRGATPESPSTPAAPAMVR